jgi:membrane peptidoglycan carboxypeptidase
MGLTWPDGKSLLKADPKERHWLSADNLPSFTLGAANVAPIDVAASDAVLPARGIYCHPIVVTKIVTSDGGKLPVESPKCHRVLSTQVADAANYILQGDLTGEGTAPGDAIGRPAAAKTGTADQYVSAFFVGYTPHLLGAVWVGNPADPYTFPMSGYPGSCYRVECGGVMYGSMAPGQTWQMTFLHAPLGPPVSFVPLSPSSAFYSMGTGIAPTSIAKPKPKPKPKPTGGGGGGGGGGNGNGNSNGNGNGGGGGG